MGLFGGSKSSTTQTTVNETAQSTIGDLSSRNTIVYGDTQGILGADLDSILTQNQSILDKALSSIQGSAEKAISSSADAYATSSSETKQFFDSLRPYGFYAVVGFVVYFLFRKAK